MNNPTFQRFLEMCELEATKKYISELLSIIKNSDCIYNSGIIMPRDHILNIYKVRLEIAKESKRLSVEEILDFSNCVKNIEETDSENIGIVNLTAENNLYMIFYEPSQKKIVGIIRFNQIDAMKNSEIYNDDTIEKGYSSKSEKYSKQNLIKSWK